MVGADIRAIEAGILKHIKKEETKASPTTITISGQV